MSDITSIVNAVWLRIAQVAMAPVSAGLQTNDTDAWKAIGSIYVNWRYLLAAQARLQVVLGVTTGATVQFRLYNVTLGTVLSGSELSSVSVISEVQEVEVALPTGNNLYEAQIRLALPNAGTDQARCTSSRLVMTSI